MDEDTGKCCTKCGERKPLSEFSPQRGGRRAGCKACQREYQRKARKADPERYREMKRKAQRRYAAAHPEYVQHQKEQYIQLREAVFDHYGRVCTCCGAASDLSIDHPDGDGSAHRIALFGQRNAAGTRMYLWLVRQGFPAGYQVLCMPCNRSKGDGAVCRLHSPPRHCPTCTCMA
jgi:hypothetical protein